MEKWFRDQKAFAEELLLEQLFPMEKRQLSPFHPGEARDLRFSGLVMEIY